MQNKDLKTLGVLGVVGFLFSIPVMIWKSSKLGKVIALVLFLVVIGGTGTWMLGKFTDVYYTKIKHREMLDQDLKPVKAQIASLKKDVGDTERRIGKIDEELTRRVNLAKGEYESILQSQKVDVESKLKDLLEGLNEAESALRLIQEWEREALKGRIIGLKEDVKLHGKSIDSTEIRLQCELVAEHMMILDKETRDRFYADLKDIGFNLDKQEERVVGIYTGSYYASTMNSIMQITSGSTVSIYDNEYDRRGRRLRVYR